MRKVEKRKGGESINNTFSYTDPIHKRHNKRETEKNTLGDRPGGRRTPLINGL